MKKSELKKLIKEAVNIELKQKYNDIINQNYEAFLDTIGKEYEEVFSRRLFNLFEKYKKQFGEKHPLEFEWNKKSSLNESKKTLKQVTEEISFGVNKIKQMLKDKGYV